MVRLKDGDKCPKCRDGIMRKQVYQRVIYYTCDKCDNNVAYGEREE